MFAITSFVLSYQTYVQAEPAYLPGAIFRGSKDQL
jgi:hypothetical protein